MLPSRSLTKQTADGTEPDYKLPLWDGTHLTGLPWLRELEACEHMFDADVAYYLRTGAVVTSAAKTAVSSLEHSALLSQDIIRKQNYCVSNPIPDDNFKALYADIQTKIAAGEAPFTGPAIKAALPTKPALVSLPDNHVLSPDRIMVIDLKLRNAILALITSRGRKLHYQQLTQSGATLLKHLINDTQPSAGTYGSLLYAATNTRPDIAYAVGMLRRAMGKPTPPDLYAAGLRVVAYLAHHKHIGLRYECDQVPLSGMSDADWAVRHSTSGFVFSMSKAAISWGSKKQPSIALSSCESEIMAASEAAKEAVYLDRFVAELGFMSRSVHADTPQTSQDFSRLFGTLYGEGLGSPPWVCDLMGPQETFF